MKRRGNSGKTKKTGIGLKKLTSISQGMDLLETLDALIRSLPDALLLRVLQMAIDAYHQRGGTITDFDHKDKDLRDVRKIGNRIYFLAGTTERADESVKP